MDKDCQMCGKGVPFFFRWYQYDNGEQFRARVCKKCADLHDRLIGGSK